MKKDVISIILIAIAIIFMLPAFSTAAYFYSTEGYYENPSFYGIFDAIKRQGDAWLDSELPDISGLWSTNQQSRTNPGGEIWDVGCQCIGHRSQGAGGYRMRIKYIIDIGKDIIVKHSDNGIQNITDSSQKVEYYRLGYYISKSSSIGESGSSTWRTWKAQIACWLGEHGYNLGTNNDSMDSGLRENNTSYSRPLYEEAQAKAKEALNQKSGKFSTTSQYGEGQPQQINYDGRYTFIGPYNLNHEDGRIEGQAAITTKEGNVLNTGLYSTDGKNVQQLSSLGNYNENGFYIVYEGEVDSVQNIKITSKLKQNIIRARIVLGEPMYSSNQAIAIFHGTGSREAETEETVILPGVAESRLSIKKINRGTGRPMQNIGFVVYSVDQQAYINTNNPTNQRYVKNINEAEMFITDRNGEFTVNKLSKKGVYIIYEVVHPAAFNKRI